MEGETKFKLEILLLFSWLKIKIRKWA
jgi:hypothetical protein